MKSIVVRYLLEFKENCVKSILVRYWLHQFEVSSLPRHRRDSLAIGSNNCTLTLMTMKMIEKIIWMMMNSQILERSPSEASVGKIGQNQLLFCTFEISEFCVHLENTPKARKVWTIGRFGKILVTTKKSSHFYLFYIFREKCSGIFGSHNQNHFLQLWVYEKGPLESRNTSRLKIWWKKVKWTSNSPGSCWRCFCMKECQCQKVKNQHNPVLALP